MMTNNTDNRSASRAERKAARATQAESGVAYAAALRQVRKAYPTDVSGRQGAEELLAYIFRDGRASERPEHLLSMSGMNEADLVALLESSYDGAEVLLVDSTKGYRKGSASGSGAITEQALRAALSGRSSDTLIYKYLTPPEIGIITRLQHIARDCNTSLILCRSTRSTRTGDRVLNHLTKGGFARGEVCELTAQPVVGLSRLLQMFARVAGDEGVESLLIDAEAGGRWRTQNTTGASITTFESRKMTMGILESLVSQGGYGFVVVDSFNLVKGFSMAQVKTIARENNTAIVVSRREEQALGGLSAETAADLSLRFFAPEGAGEDKRVISVGGRITDMSAAIIEQRAFAPSRTLVVGSDRAEVTRTAMSVAKKENAGKKVVVMADDSEPWEELDVTVVSSIPAMLLCGGDVMIVDSALFGGPEGVATLGDALANRQAPYVVGLIKPEGFHNFDENFLLADRGWKVRWSNFRSPGNLARDEEMKKVHDEWTKTEGTSGPTPLVDGQLSIGKN